MHLAETTGTISFNDIGHYMNHTEKKYQKWSFTSYYCVICLSLLAVKEFILVLNNEIIYLQYNNYFFFNSRQMECGGLLTKGKL